MVRQRRMVIRFSTKNKNTNSILEKTMAETSNFLSKIRKISGEVPGNYSFILPSNFCFGSLIFAQQNGWGGQKGSRRFCARREGNRSDCLWQSFYHTCIAVSMPKKRFGTVYGNCPIPHSGFCAGWETNCNSLFQTVIPFFFSVILLSFLANTGI